ncbi:MAG: ABC transporter ATP-binding protein [Acidimicrobiales bacterium]
MSGKSKSQRSKDQARQRADAAAAKRGDDAVEETPPPKKSSWLPDMPEDRPTPRAVEKGAVLVAEELAKDYGDGRGLQGLDLVVQPGEVVMLVGPNGAGKSTFLGCCSGLVEPTDGAAWLGGHLAGSIEARGATSYIPDSPVLYEDLSVWEHLEYLARLHATQDWVDYAEDLLDMFNLAHRADELPTKFSRGLKQKTALIVGLIRPFSVLLIDEPFAGLDVPGQETLVEVIGDLAEQGASIICSTHQLDLLAVATRLVGLQDGLLAFDGKPSEQQIRELVGG